MNREVIKRVTTLAITTVVCVTIMFNVESENINNLEKINATKENIEKEKRSLDSLKQVKKLEQNEVEVIRREKEYLQKLPEKKDIKKIKFR